MLVKKNMVEKFTRLIQIPKIIIMNQCSWTLLTPIDVNSSVRGCFAQKICFCCIRFCRHWAEKVGPPAHCERRQAAQKRPHMLLFLIFFFFFEIFRSISRNCRQHLPCLLIWEILQAHTRGLKVALLFFFRQYVGAYVVRRAYKYFALDFSRHFVNI